MKRSTVIVRGVLVLGAIAGCAYLYRYGLGLFSSGSRQQNATPDQGISEPGPPKIVWQMVDRSPDGFKVQMPTGTNQIQVPAFNERGDEEPVAMILASPDSQTTFAVAWADHPPVERASSQDAEKTLDMAQDGALARTQAVLISQSRTRIDGFPACDFLGRNDHGGILNVRLLLAGTRLYMLTAAFPSASARRDEDVNRFFDSFKLTPASGSN